jgi:hypothetical protein
MWLYGAGVGEMPNKIGDVNLKLAQEWSHLIPEYSMKMTAAKQKTNSTGHRIYSEAACRYSGDYS